MNTNNMSKTLYTEAQKEELLRNKYVLRCTNKHVTYTKECKYKAVTLCNKGLTSKEIFMRLWLPKFIINSDIPRKAVSRWKLIIKERWKEWFEKSTRWRKKHIDFSNMSKEEYIKYLETEVAYLKELNSSIKLEYP